jgi:hypothetical protein
MLGTSQGGPRDSRFGTATRSAIEIAMNVETAAATGHRFSMKTFVSAEP